MDFFFF